MNSTRLLLIDDHPLFRNGLAQLFAASEDFDVVGQAGSGREGIAMAVNLAPALVLLDLHMPGLSGLQVLDELRQLQLGCKIMVLTASIDRDELLTAMRLGANGYVLKETEPDALLCHVRNCGQGAVILDDSLATLLSEQPLQSPVLDGSLTEREGQTLSLIALGMSNKQIGRELGISDGTVKVYVKSLLKKLRLHSRLELAAWVHRFTVPDRPRSH
ncbi:response regulator [Pseudomonas silvicola]|nr:response regulator [Pseudomonas silvicola]